MVRVARLAAFPFPMGMESTELPSSSRRQATVRRTVALNCSNLLLKEKIGKSMCSFRFFGPSGETRTRGILVPKTEGNFFLTISAPFSGVSFQYPVLSGTVFSTVSGCSNPVYGQKCGQRPGLSKSQGVLDSRKQNSETEKLTSIPSRKFRNRNFADEMIEFA